MHAQYTNPPADAPCAPLEPKLSPHHQARRKPIFSRIGAVSIPRVHPPSRKWSAGPQDSEPGHTQADSKLAALLYARSTEAMMVTDSQNRIVAVNPAFVHITGYTAQEVVGADSSILHAPQQDALFYKNMHRKLQANGQWQGELWSRHKNGESFPGWLSIGTVYNNAGEVEQRVTLFTDLTHRKASEALIWRQANFDPITQLPNRSMLKYRLAQEIKKVDRYGRTLALLSIHLDNFAAINESHDEDFADDLLLQASRRIADCVRVTDSVARTGSDTFVALLVGLDSAERASRMAQTILHRLAQPFELDTAMVAISGSIGITIYPGEDAPREEMLHNAQQAMYAARHQGGNQYSFFTPALQHAAQKRAQTIKELRTAVAEQQFCLHFQPIVELATGHIHKTEALVRWQHPQRGLLGPGEFIALAEENRLIGDIGDWVFKEAARWALQWRTRHCPDLQISVNKSPAQFGRTNNYAAGWTDYLRQLGLPGNAIAVEITEGLLLNSTPAIDHCLRSYRDAGMQIAIDDFGTGYSSLSYLKNLDLDYLKIDRSFVCNLAPGSRDMALCEAIVVMAHKLGLKVIAEGIETKEQRDFLTAIGCDYGQGYLFSRPVPPADFEQVLASR
jgi:diguanylate cyclase (GGDEF)-like protein/PAS domain S-box-containing protein